MLGTFLLCFSFMYLDRVNKCWILQIGLFSSKTVLQPRPSIQLCFKPMSTYCPWRDVIRGNSWGDKNFNGVKVEDMEYFYHGKVHFNGKVQCCQLYGLWLAKKKKKTLWALLGLKLYPFTSPNLVEFFTYISYSNLVHGLLTVLLYLELTEIITSILRLIISDW